MPNLWNDLSEIAEQIRRKLDAPVTPSGVLNSSTTLREAAHVGTRLAVALAIIEGHTDIESTSITLRPTPVTKGEK